MDGMEPKEWIMDYERGLVGGQSRSVEWNHGLWTGRKMVPAHHPPASMTIWGGATAGAAGWRSDRSEYRGTCNFTGSSRN